MPTLLPFGRVALFTALVLSASAQAQSFGELQQDDRPFVPSLMVDAMGGATVAFPQAETAFFYNPAHLARTADKLRFTVLGVGLGLSTNASDKYEFWTDDLEPAIDEGIDEIRENDYDRLEALYNRAIELGREQSVATAVVYGPSVQLGLPSSLGLGPGAAVGAGVYGTNTTRLQFGGGIVPSLDFYGQADVIVPLSVASTIPGTPLAAGLTASYTQRYLTAKAKSIDAFGSQGEHLYILKASGVRFDLGAHAADVLPGLDVGAALFNVLGSDFEYEYADRVILNGDEADPDNENEIAQLENRFNERGGQADWRAGLAYALPIPPTPGIEGVTVMADVVGASTSEFDQSMAAHLRLGTHVAIHRMFSVQAGLSQGYPSGGASVVLPGVRLDYAFLGIEDGRTLGQAGRNNHRLQLRFGRF